MRYSDQLGMTFGFSDRLRIDILTEVAPEMFADYHLLITFLDSTATSGLAKWKDRLVEWRVRFSSMRSGFLIYPDSVETLLSFHNTFFGFDEVFLLRGVPKEDFVLLEHFTTERSMFNEDLPTVFVDYFNRLAAEGFLSDGCGLNFVFRNAMEAERVSRLADD